MKTSNPNKILSFAILLFLGLCYSCSEPGNPLEGSWELYTSKINEVVEEQYTPVTWTFKNNGRFVQVMNGPDGPIERAGEYIYNTSSGELHLHFDRGSNRHVLWIVVGLDEHSLNVEYTGYGFFVEREFRKK